MVPSRSMNTARDFALVEVMFEARNQFVAGYYCRAQFSDNHSAGVIGDLRGFERRCVANQREREHRDGGVARARHIENISRLRRNVMRAFAFLEKHHPMFAESDEKVLHASHSDRKSTRLNSSHVRISYAVFCLKKKKKIKHC